MADLLGAANRVPGYDSANNNRTLPTATRPGEAQIQNIPDPTKVGRPDARTDQQGANELLQSNTFRYDSNLQTFLQQLRDAPELTAMFAKAVLWMKGLASTPGLTEGIAKELSQMMQMLKMDAKGLEEFFLGQAQSNNRFGGALFLVLRQAYQQAPGEHVRQAILNFVKRYSDFSSSQHIGEQMLRQLRQMVDYMPKSWREKMGEFSAKLENGLQAGARGDVLKLMQREVVPYLATYVERSHDMGTLRDMLNLLTLNVARYENGAEDALLLSFRQLEGYGELLSGLNKLDDAAILKLLKENNFTKAVMADQFAQQLAHTASQALKGMYGNDAREAFQEIVRAILINESVYMPLNHMMLPLEWNGKMMYSEYWVDPDAQDDQDPSSNSQERGKIQFLFKIDIESLGFLEMTLAARQQQVDLNIYGPEKVAAHSAIIAEDIREILTSHELDGKNVRVLKADKPLTLTQVFPNLFEGKCSVNVKV